LGPLYTRGPDGKLTRMDAMGAAAYREPVYLSGGGGLVSSAADYHRFTRMLLHLPASPAGELDGIRLLSPRTVGYMTVNHLPGGADLKAFGRPLYADPSVFAGVGFGLGFAVQLDPVVARTLCSAGEFHWGGAASTVFWVDPAEQLTVAFFTQLMPSSATPIRPQLRQLVYQALVA
jgi:CubicO group peptidase (beta-lactamase class C family)